MTLAGGILWGFSGACGQFLFTHKAVVSTWLVPVRLLTAGILMVLFLILTERKRAFAVWKNRRDALELVIFGVFGMSACQFTYFTAIQYSNA
ncbi:MAG: EamA family transporter, partial [Butyricicoccus sp.]|nr:EamA family transporter [Butyricicoccus sp.]